METKTKVIIGVLGTLTLGVGGYLIYRSMKSRAKEQEMLNSKKEGDIGYVEPKTTTTIATTEQAGVVTVNPATTTPSIPTLATPPAAPSLGDFNLGSFGSTEATPSNADYIRMADRYMTWENVWRFASKLGVSDKKAVGGVDGTYPDAIITNNSRRTFDSEVKSKFPNWIELLKKKARKENIDVVSDEDYRKNTDSIKSAYGIDMSYFGGSPKKVNNFWSKGL